MVKSLDGLISFLLDEIALCGEEGKSLGLFPSLKMNVHSLPSVLRYPYSACSGFKQSNVDLFDCVCSVGLSRRKPYVHNRLFNCTLTIFCFFVFIAFP